jgi:hypothetical protein
LNDDTKFTKNDDDKPAVELLPPLALLETAKVLGFGAKKYDPDNWRRVDDRRRYLAASLRHLLEYAAGKDLDEDSGLPTVAHAACSVLFLLEAHLEGLGEDTRPKRARDDETPKNGTSQKPFIRAPEPPADAPFVPLVPPSEPERPQPERPTAPPPDRFTRAWALRGEEWECSSCLTKKFAAERYVDIRTGGHVCAQCRANDLREPAAAP